MPFPRHIFKKYDIRGLVGTEVDVPLARALGFAFAAFRARELGRPFSCVVGRDMRQSSSALQNALMQALVEAGVHVFDVGLVSTPAFYFSVGHVGAEAGIIVSASHNPAAYNGFKLTRERAVPVSGDDGIEEIADLVEQYMQGGAPPTPTSAYASTRGDVETVVDIPVRAVEAEIARAGDRPIARYKIVADAANGMGAQYLDALFAQVDADVHRMYWDPDGSFPNHEADPFNPENTEDLCARVREVGADVGIATDGDGDRIFFVDETGTRVEPAALRGLLAQIELRSFPGARICYDIRPGRITRDLIEQAGGVPVVTRVGHSLIKDRMRSVDAPFGGESSGHFFYRFATGVYEGPVTAACELLQEMTARGEKLSEIVGPLNHAYAHSGEINFTVSDKDAVLSALKQRYADGQLDELDGITITYPTFWFNVRASNTEPKLRLNLEATDQRIMQEKVREVSTLIQSS